MSNELVIVNLVTEIEREIEQVSTSTRKRHKAVVETTFVWPE